MFSQFIDEYLRLAVACNHLEVVLDVIAFALSALKHATAVVLHTLQSGVASFRTIVLSLLNEPHSASDSAEEQDSDMLITTTGGASEHFKKREVLCKEATRWLHVMFELHHQLRPIVSERTQAHLDDLTPAAFAADPKKAIKAIYHRAHGKHYRRSVIARMRNADIPAYRPSSAGSAGRRRGS